jgi:hypothetical protein
MGIGTKETIMDGYQLAAAMCGAVLVIGFIISEISRLSYERGFDVGYRRGVSSGRSQVRADR